MSDTIVAETIAAQMGGIGRLTVMVGAKQFVSNPNEKRGSLTFKFMKGKDGINCVKIVLNGSDLYDVTFYKIGRTKFTEVKTINDLYFDQLIETFEQETCLYLSL